MLRRCLAAALCLMVFGSSVMAQESLDKRPVLAVSVLPTMDQPLSEEAFIAAFIDAVQTAADAGATGNLATEVWSKLEMGPGEFTIDGMGGLLSFLGDTQDQTLLLGIQVINTTIKETPADLLDVPFDSPEMLRRFMALIDALAPHIDEHVRYLSIGNEVDAYLSSHDEWEAYTRFYEAAAAYVHLVRPDIQVGVTVTFGGAQMYPEKVADLTTYSDIIILTYYPLNPDFSVQAPDSPLRDFPLMLEMAGDKPLLLQEVGYPAAESLGSSEADQAAFVESVFEAWAAAGDRIPFLNFFAMGDFSKQMCDDFLAYYHLPDSQIFYDYLCTLGLRRADGTPRPSWDVFAEEGLRLAGDSSD